MRISKSRNLFASIFILSFLSIPIIGVSCQNYNGIKNYYIQRKSYFTNDYYLHSNWTTPEWTLVRQGIFYKYSESDLPFELVQEKDKLRSLVTDEKEIKIGFTGLDPEADFKIKLYFLSNTKDRIFSFLVDDKIILENLALPYGKALEQVVDIPHELIKDETINISLIKKQGANVVLSGIELWSNKRKSLIGLDVNIQGDFKGNIFGIVKDYYGTPVSDVNLHIVHEEYDNELSLSTDLKGRFFSKVPDNWRTDDEKWIYVSAIKERYHGENILTSIELFLPRLSPIPAWIKSVSEPVIDLNGVWKFNPVAPDNSYDPDLKLLSWANIKVPGEWGMQGFNTMVDSAAAYRRTIDIPSDWNNKRVKLRFDAVYSETDIWMNGIKVGHHMGTYTPF